MNGSLFFIIPLRKVLWLLSFKRQKNAKKTSSLYERKLVFYYTT